MRICGGSVGGQEGKECRLERAARLLADNHDMLLSTVAGQCGFEDTSSFDHTFKRIYGCTPSQYREQN